MIEHPNAVAYRKRMLDQTVTNSASAKAHVETALWLAHLHGMSANLGWYWSREADGAIAGASWFKGSLLQQPWMMHGYAQETLSLRRFVQPVQAFAQQPRPVRLLYSEASAIQDVGYLDALRDAMRHSISWACPLAW